MAYFRGFVTEIFMSEFKEFNIPYEHVILGFSDSLLASRFDFYEVILYLKSTK